MAEEKEKKEKEEAPKPSELVKSEDNKTEISKPEEGGIISAEDYEQLPSEAKKQFSRMFSMFMSSTSGPAPHPILSKINTEQVGKVIDYVETESIRDHKNRMSSRRWSFAALVIVLLFILSLAAGCLWKDKLEYIAPIITAIIGAAGGYGVGLTHGRRG